MFLLKHFEWVVHDRESEWIEIYLLLLLLLLYLSLSPDCVGVERWRPLNDRLRVLLGLVHDRLHLLDRVLVGFLLIITEQGRVRVKALHIIVTVVLLLGFLLDLYECLLLWMGDFNLGLLLDRWDVLHLWGSQECLPLFLLLCHLL